MNDTDCDCENPNFLSNPDFEEISCTPSFTMGLAVNELECVDGWVSLKTSEADFYHSSGRTRRPIPSERTTVIPPPHGGGG